MSGRGVAIAVAATAAGAPRRLHLFPPRSDVQMETKWTRHSYAPCNT